MRRETYMQQFDMEKNGSLHIQPWVLREERNFTQSLSKRKLDRCITCGERWPRTTQLRASGDNFQCSRCAKDKDHLGPLFSKENQMWPSPLVVTTSPELVAVRDATVLERMLCARVFPIMRIYRKANGVLGYTGHILSLPVNVMSVFSRIPVDLSEIPFFIIRRENESGFHRDGLVRALHVYTLCVYLRRHNRYYQDVNVAPLEEVQSVLPTNAVPEAVFLQDYVDDSSQSLHDAGPNPADSNESDPYQESVLQVRVSMAQQLEIIRTRLQTGEDNATRRATYDSVPVVEHDCSDSRPIDEFNTEGLLAMSFPTLFLTGDGDPTQIDRLRSVGLHEGARHLIKMAWKDPDSPRFIYPFASDERFAAVVLDMLERHRALTEANYVMTQHPAIGELTVGELKHLAQTNSDAQLVAVIYRYAANITGSDPYWYQRRRGLEAICDQISLPTVFFTFSFADKYHPSLLDLLDVKVDDSYEVRRDAVNANPHLVDSFFCRRMEALKSHFLNNVLDAEWSWFRYEYQMRGALHAHGCSRLKNDPGLAELAAKGYGGWCAKRRLSWRQTYCNWSADERCRQAIAADGDNEQVNVS